MSFEPDEVAHDEAPILVDDAKQGPWRPVFRHGCSFPPDVFTSVMDNLIRNPNINSSWLFRADILHDVEGTALADPVPRELAMETPEVPRFPSFELTRFMVRKFIPRNTMRDGPMDQSCLIYENALPADPEAHHDGGVQRTLVIYLPHVCSEAEMPFYHPKVRGIAFLHEWTPSDGSGVISISYQYFDDCHRSDVKLTRTALQLLKVLYKHGQGRVAGYQKRVYHDVLIPQVRFQDTYAALKHKYARELITGWAEVTDPDKHVFEDLSIAAFMIELWADMYGKASFPGFVDIGCGNGLLVHILNREGYHGWGFDARARKSWKMYNTVRPSLPGSSDPEGNSLQQLVLLPPPVSRTGLTEMSTDGFAVDLVHDGRFPRNTFIISNHTDELTPWTPILAAISDCPFIMIPCCSHDLTGSKYRAPAPKDKRKGGSSYASLVEWVAGIGKDCGWLVEQEMLRIPSTRNTALVGRKKDPAADPSTVDIQAIVNRYGGTAGYLENVIKLAKKSAAARHEPAVDGTI
jgi:tRNASer (uridine44-2'-O)-methyltransferase